MSNSNYKQSNTTRRQRTNQSKPLASRRLVRDYEQDRQTGLIPVSVRHRRISTATTQAQRLSEGQLGTPFYPIDSDWLYDQIQKLVHPDYHINRLFYDGDHWQNGDAWTGPRPDSQDANLRLVMDQIRRAFVSKNVIKEVTKRKANGAISKEPHWYFTERATQKKQRVPPQAATPPTQTAKPFPPNTTTTEEPPAPALTAAASTPPTEGEPPAPPNEEEEPTKLQQPPEIPATPEENPDIVEVEEALTEWWDNHKVHKVFKDFVTNALLNGRSTLRFYVPPGAGAIDEMGNVTLTPDLSLAEAMDYIELHAPFPDKAAILVNPLSMREMGVYTWEEQDKQHAEIVYLEGRGKEAITIIQEVPQANEPTDQTTRITPQSASTTPDGEPPEPSPTGANVFVDKAELELGGYLTIFEISVDPLITEQVRSLQKSINKALTMADNNLTLGGFLERTILNGQMPGHFEPDPNDPTRKKQRWVRDNYETGGGAVNFIQGTPQYGPQGEYLGLANPSIVYRDPVDMTNFEVAKDMYYRALLEEVDQLHYLLSGEQYASGESRKQSRADFEASLRELISDLNMAGRWVIETLVAYACWLRNTARQFEELRGVFEARMDPGPATTEGQRGAIELRDAKLLSPQTAMVWAGVDDPDAEQRLIDQYDQEHPDPIATAAAGIDPNTGQPIALLTTREKSLGATSNGATSNGTNGRTGREAGLIAEDTLEQSERQANPKPRIVNPSTSRRTKRRK